jgi:hypothetical protein
MEQALVVPFLYREFCAKNAIVAHPSFGLQLSKGLSLNVDSFFYGDKEPPMESILKPACSCARDRHRGRATWVQRRI